eukprot:comp11417_c0_seq1/m.5809 comp11417_c0_seq1/g.5809  ORF comp11417_c0_seq1/g.5809 comp11417_c0_seq1/m.5809 type:complete len:340 (-) comp11417_c0_seq1:334-1353(-)
MVAEEYAVDEKALCEGQGQLYDVKILEVKVEGGKSTYKIHYQGWAKRYDTWVGPERLTKHTAEEVAKQKALREAVEKAKTKKGVETQKQEGEKRKQETEQTGKESKKGKEVKKKQSGKKKEGVDGENNVEKTEEERPKKKTGSKKSGGGKQKKDGENAPPSPSTGIKRPSTDDTGLSSARKQVAVTYQRKKPRLSTGETPVLGRSSTDQWLAVLSATKPPAPPTTTPSRILTTKAVSPTPDTKPTDEKTQTQTEPWVGDDSNTPVTDGDSPSKATATAPKRRRGAQQTKGAGTQAQASARKSRQAKASGKAEEKGEEGEEKEEEGVTRRSSRRQAAGNV